MVSTTVVGLFVIWIAAIVFPFVVFLGFFVAVLVTAVVVTASTRTGVVATVIGVVFTIFKTMFVAVIEVAT